MAENSFEDGDFDGVEGLEGLADFLNAIGDTAPAPDEPVPVALLDGATVKGPFKDCDAQGYPLVEVWEVELGAGGHARPQRLGMVGMLPHDAGPGDVLATYGPGIWVCTVRGASGKIIRQRFVATGSKDQRQSKAARRQQPMKPAEVADGSPPWMQQFLAQQAELAAEARKRQEEEARATREELARIRREEEERRREENRAMREEIQRLRQAPPSPSKPADHVNALREWIGQGEEIKSTLSLLVPQEAAAAPQAQKGFMEEVAGELGNFLKNAADLKELLAVVK